MRPFVVAVALLLPCAALAQVASRASQCADGAPGPVGPIGPAGPAGTMLNSVTTVPAAPASGDVSFVFHQGATTPGVIGNIGTLGIANFQMPFVGAGRPTFGCITPIGYGTSSLSGWGIAGASTVTGTASINSLDISSLFGRSIKITYDSASSSTGPTPASAGLRGNSHNAWRGNGNGSGGFDFWIACGLKTTVTGQRFFCGLKDASAAISTTAEPSSVKDAVFLACDSGQTTLRICSNDASATANCADLGANFPCTAGAYYNFRVWAKPSDTVVGYQVDRVDAAQAAAGTLTTQLPRVASIVGLAYDLTINTGPTATDAVSSAYFGGTCLLANP